MPRGGGRAQEENMVEKGEIVHYFSQYIHICFICYIQMYYVYLYKTRRHQIITNARRQLINIGLGRDKNNKR